MSNLLEAIQNAFPRVPFPRTSPITIIVGDDEGVAEALRESAWWEIPAVELRRLCAVTTITQILTPEAFVYFSPSFMQAYLLDETDLDAAIDSFIAALGSPEDPKYPQFQRAREIRDKVTPSQREVVKIFLVQCARESGKCGVIQHYETLKFYELLSQVT